MNDYFKSMIFKSFCHQRYENGNPVMGLQNCIRTISVEKNIAGCRGYNIESGYGYIVKIYNNDLGKPNMSDKPMKIIAQTEDKIELRGYIVEAMSPFGWQEVDYSTYGLTIHYKHHEIEKCVFHMFDRSIDIVYMKSLASESNTKYPTLHEISEGANFRFCFKKIIVQKVDYAQNATEICCHVAKKGEHLNVIERINAATVKIDLNEKEKLVSLGITDINLIDVSELHYMRHSSDMELVVAENILGKYRPGLFQISIQKGEVIPFILYTPKGIADYYYMIMLREIEE